MPSWMTRAAISHTASQTRLGTGNLGDQPADAEQAERDPGDGQDDPPASHQRTSILVSHLVLSTPGRFGAISRSG